MNLNRAKIGVCSQQQYSDGACATVIPKWNAVIIKTGDVYINGGGKTSVDVCFFENTAHMNIFAATASEEMKEQVYNVTVGDRTTVNDLFKSPQTALKECDIEGTHEFIYHNFRAGDVLHSKADIGKAKGDLHYYLEYHIFKGIIKAVPWYKSFINDTHSI